MLSLIYGRLDEQALRVGKPISSSDRSQAFYSSIVCTSTLYRTVYLFLLVILWYDRYKEQHQASRWSGWYDPSSFSTSAPDSSACRLLSPFKISAIARPNLQIREWSFARSQRVKTVSLTILNVASDIHAFSLAPCLGIRDISP